ncbi:nucleotidyltransferase family protein [Streptacidiphilus fuscans]|uniref:Nucleotidyltransferase family protein n=1 Tax=Streptacidiphilus fuscans TaxID=2789292 RepID=A0A931B6B9_9ACTN|nr:nucleotidyltransferase family protein [Streptacidiphilus fuscans]MBF9070252.1 nucleotidyltransferase family protein [Streptacidiphilus fuscans]
MSSGLLLAAGGGRRMGNRPKALLPYRGRPMIEHALGVLRAGGCARIRVVLGASAEEVLRTAELGDAEVVLNPDWASGMGSSLRAGLDGLDADLDADGVLVGLVDTPGVTAEAVRRVLGSGAELAAASYGGERGHPVYFARRFFAEAREGAVGDAGARALLRAHAGELVLVECGDVATPDDVDTPEQFAALRWGREELRE